MRGIRSPLQGVRSPFGNEGSTFSIALTGLTDGEARIGDHASIGYTITPDNGTETVALGTAPGDDTYGTGANPTDYTAGDGDDLWLTVTDGGRSRSISAPIRYAPATAAGALVDQTVAQNTGIQIYDASGDFTENGNTLTFSVNSVAGVSIGSVSGVVVIDTASVSIQENTSIVVSAVDAYGRAAVTSGFSLTVEAEPSLSTVSFTDVLADGVGTPVTLTSPSISAPQPFQRGVATIVMSGALDVTGGSASGMAWRIGSGDWYPFINETITSSTWEGTLFIPSDYLAQGNLEIKPVNGLNVTPAQIADVSATDVIIAMGQSNCNGSADVTDTYTKTTFDWYDKVQTGAWAKATGDTSIFPAFAEDLDQAGVPPAVFRPVTAPGTGFVSNDWNPGDSSYNLAVARLNGVLNGTGGCAGVVWIQGEKEASTNLAGAEAWNESFEAMVAGMRDEVSRFVNEPWFVTLTWNAGDGEDAVRTSQLQVIDGNSWAYEGLTVLGETMGDSVHYGSTGAIDATEAEAQLNRLGARLHRNVARQLHGTTTAIGSPQITGYSVSGSTITVTFDRDMANHTDPDGWAVADDEGARTVSSSAQGASADEVVLTCDQALYGPVLVSFAKGSLASASTLADTETVPFPPRPSFDESAGTGVGAAPTLDTAPTISGIPQVALQLTGSDGTYDGVPSPTVGSYQWQISDNGTSGWSDISGATSENYTPVTADEGKYVRRKETATNAVGSVDGFTSATAQIAAEGTFNFPSDLAAVIEWWDMSDAGSITVRAGSANDVNGVQSQLAGGNDLEQTSISFMPRTGTRTENSLNVVDFDGVDNRLIMTTPADQGQPAAYIVAGNSTYFRGGVRFLSGGSDFYPTDTSRNGLHLWEVSFDPDTNTATIYFDGAQIAQNTSYTDTDAGHWFVLADMDGSSNANDAVMWHDTTNGYTVGGVGQFADGGIGEVVICDSVLSGTDLSSLRTYFANKWGITI